MGFMDYITDVGKSLAGNISKAVLCIRAVGALTKTEEQAPGEKKDGLSAEVRSAITDVNKTNKSLMKRAEKTLKKGVSAAYEDVVADVSANGYIALEVQYNPSSIRLDTTAGRQRDYSTENGFTSVTVVETPASTTLSCELLFDDVNNMDAFMLSDNPLTNLTVSNVANTVTSLVKKNYSVKRQMEGLLSLLTLPQAKHVIFFWGSMSFRGEITDITTSYTMFNKKGFPVRGVLDLVIRQGDGTDAAVGMEKSFKYDEEYWQKAFDECFKEDVGEKSLFDKATSNSMLNLKL
ncbi:MAG: hypothetical protein K5989_04975 [Lachnospiraceae bacterium]|nr:hypothetical protein [Lachnospiraceae bacterium]